VESAYERKDNNCPGTDLRDIPKVFERLRKTLTRAGVSDVQDVGLSVFEDDTYISHWILDAASGFTKAFSETQNPRFKDGVPAFGYHGFVVWNAGDVVPYLGFVVMVERKPYINASVAITPPSTGRFS